MVQLNHPDLLWKKVYIPCYLCKYVSKKVRWSLMCFTNYFYPLKKLSWRRFSIVQPPWTHVKITLFSTHLCDDEVRESSMRFTVPEIVHSAPSTLCIPWRDIVGEGSVQGRWSSMSLNVIQLLHIAPSLLLSPVEMHLEKVQSSRTNLNSIRTIPNWYVYHAIWERINFCSERSMRSSYPELV